MMPAATIESVLRDLSMELRELNHHVGRVKSVTATEFLREHVSQNKPLVITNAISHWPALRRWNPEHLAERAGDSLVTVALTPGGLADAPALLPDGTPAFVLPYQQRMTLADFFSLLQRRQQGDLVPYLQHQNSSLTSELPQLLDDAAADLPWATEAFGAPPEAVNIWVGGPRSVTSWHRDHYENLYAVVSGYKTFRLLPPTDAYRLRLRRYRLATYRSACPRGKVQPSGAAAAKALPTQLEAALHEPPETVLWSSLLPKPIFCGMGSLGADGGRGDVSGPASVSDADGLSSLLDDPSLPPPFQVTVGPGEVLYLPSCWWHEVHQHAQPLGALSQPCGSSQGASGECGSSVEGDGAASGGGGVVIAVNYWYDMRYDCKYAFSKAAEDLAAAAGLNQEPPS